MSRRIEASVSPPLEDLVAARASNRTPRHRTLPLIGNAEFYMREGKLVLRKKTSRMPSLPQQQAIRYCASQAKGKDFKSRAEVYEFFDKCMAEQGFPGK
ncbi:MAG TPA: hypothetical protein ENL41_00460 [candidate division WOR-3 bacterium]|uniref:Uncharacterized protein n=1 Tax=candidate division WOR-3 bacterium TaxID=2052148 RepID=A0A7C5I447_UNCW3|nr:hypothetical protein [candidate division WOR-3 bacterium]